MKYNVTVSRFGFVTIEAESEEDARRIANSYREDDISWSDDIEVTDVFEAD